MKRYFGNLIELDDEGYEKLSDIVCTIFEAYPPVYTVTRFSTFGVGVILATTDYCIDVIVEQYPLGIFRGKVEIFRDGYRECIVLNHSSPKEEILDDVFKTIDRVLIKCL